MSEKQPRQINLPFFITCGDKPLEDLDTYHGIALRVDELADRPIRMKLRKHPNEHPNQPDIEITGSETAIDIFKRAVKTRNEAISAGSTGKAIEAAMNVFFDLQRIRLRAS